MGAYKMNGRLQKSGADTSACLIIGSCGYTAETWHGACWEFWQYASRIKHLKVTRTYNYREEIYVST